MASPAPSQIERNIGECLDSGNLRGAADESVRAYGGEIAGYLLALLRDEAAADEVFSRVCEKLWRGLPGFRRRSSLRTWLYRLAWNAARDFQREQGRAPTRPLRTTEISAIAARISASRPRFERSSFADAFEKLREGLGPDEQTLLTLRLHAGLSWNEIGEVLRRKPATLRKRFERLKERLRTQAEAAGLFRS